MSDTWRRSLEVFSSSTRTSTQGVGGRGAGGGDESEREGRDRPHPGGATSLGLGVGRFNLPHMSQTRSLLAPCRSRCWLISARHEERASHLALTSMSDGFTSAAYVILDIFNFSNPHF